MSAPNSALEAWRARVKDWQQSSREPGLSALLILETALIFLEPISKSLEEDCEASELHEAKEVLRVELPTTRIRRCH